MALADGRTFHVNINCSELDRSRRFYVDCLGLTEGVRTAAADAQPGAAFGLDRARWDAWILLGPRAFEGSAIDLLEWQEPAPRPGPPARFEACGFQRLGLVVPVLDATLQRVRDLGGAIWSDPSTHSIAGGGEVRLVMVNDPDGTPLELIEGHAPSVAFVAVVCADLDQSIAFYRTLGFREVARFPSTNTDGSHLRVDGPVVMEEVMLRAPTKSEMNIILVGFSTPAPVRAEARPANTIGPWRTALLVADLDAAYEELGRLGITTFSAPTTMAMGPGLPELRFLCFAGPDGEVLELIEQPR